MSQGAEDHPRCVAGAVSPLGRGRSGAVVGDRHVGPRRTRYPERAGRFGGCGQTVARRCRQLLDRVFHPGSPLTFVTCPVRTVRCPSGSRVPWSDVRDVRDPSGAGLVPYEDAWARQRAIHENRGRGHGSATPSCCSSTHPFTPRAGAPRHGSAPPTAPRYIDVDRGGLITWHGPGQLVGYPIVRARRARWTWSPTSGGWSGCSSTCAPRSGVAAHVQVEGRSGAWIAADEQRAASARSPRSVCGSRAASRCTASR